MAHDLAREDAIERLSRSPSAQMLTLPEPTLRHKGMCADSRVHESIDPKGLTKMKRHISVCSTALSYLL